MAVRDVGRPIRSRSRHVSTVAVCPRLPLLVLGFRHISPHHGQDWHNTAVYTGENCRDLADFAIEQTLRVPQSGYPRENVKNDTWAFKAPLEIRDDRGQVRDVYYPVVVVAGNDGKSITAYPTRDPA